MFPIILASILFTITFLVIFVPFVSRNRRHERESGRLPLFETFCTGFIGVSGKVSSVRLSVYDEFIVICYIRPYLINLAEIRYCQRSFLTWWELIEIEHRSSTAPQNIQLGFEDTATFQKIMMKKGVWQNSP